MSSASPVSVTCLRIKLRSLGWSLSSASEMSWSCSVIVQLPGIWFIYSCRRVADENILWRLAICLGTDTKGHEPGFIYGKTFFGRLCGSGTISQSLHSKEFCHHAKGHRLLY